MPRCQHSGPPPCTPPFHGWNGPKGLTRQTQSPCGRTGERPRMAHMRTCAQSKEVLIPQGRTKKPGVCATTQMVTHTPVYSFRYPCESLTLDPKLPADPPVTRYAQGEHCHRSTSSRQKRHTLPPLGKRPGKCLPRAALRLQRDCSAGANVSACAALRAHLGVDRVLLALGDSPHGTLVNTCAASNTIITNYVCHNLQVLLFI